MAETTGFDTRRGSRESIKKILIQSYASSLTPAKIITDSRLARFKVSVNTSGTLLSVEDYVSLRLVDKVTSAKFSVMVEKNKGILDTNQYNFLRRVTRKIRVLETAHPELIRGARSLNKDVDKIQIRKFTGDVVSRSVSNISLESTGGSLFVGVENPEHLDVDKKTLKINQDYLKDLVSSAKDKYSKIHPEDTEEISPSYKTYLESGVSTDLPSQQEEIPTYSTYVESGSATSFPSQQEEIPQQIEAPESEGLRIPREPIKRGINTLTDSAKSLFKQGSKNASSAAKQAISKGATKAATMLAPLAAKAGLILAGLGLLLGLMVSIIIWTILFILGFIFFAIIILFIINSGAYIVPQGGFIQPGENPYIKVVKTSVPSGNQPNGSITVNYDVTISAIQSALSNISFDETCNVTPQGNCPSPGDIKAGPSSVPRNQWRSFASFDEVESSVSIVAASDPYVIIYSRVLSFSDSRVTDTFTVNAEVDGNNTNGSGSASICFGDCPTGCYEIVRESEWGSERLASIYGAISHLASVHPNYIDKVCSSGLVPICYDNTSHGFWGCHHEYINLPICDLGISS